MNGENLLEMMGKVVPGDHMVLLYDEEDIISNTDVLASYIVSRIKKNEKCFYISGGIDGELIKEKLRLSINLEEAISSRQLLILSKNETYSKDGKFDPEKMINTIKKMALEAIENGYSALAITGEISWLLEYDDGFERIMHYEHLLNEEIFNSYPVSAICRYNISKYTSSMIKNIIQVHPLIIFKGKVHENPFYFELVDTGNVDIEKYEVDSMLESIMKFTRSKSRFHNKLKDQERKYQELQLHLLEDMVLTLTGFLEIHDKYTKNHSQRVASISELIAREMSLPEKDIVKIYYAGLVHDIGKTLVPKEIINKKGKLSEEEYELVKEHPYFAYKALINSEELKDIAEVVLSHHERYDGMGYPYHLKGEDIILESRIISIADAFEAMTSERPYRKAFSKEEAINEIKKNAGEQFDPNITAIAIEKVFNFI